jgi:histidinol dehydrogenase
MFLKMVTHMDADKPASLKLAKCSETQGAYEDMDAHRFAAAIRLSNLKE